MPATISPRFILKSRNLLHKDLQQHSFPSIENHIRQKQDRRKKVSYSVIKNSAQKSHDHSKSQSIPTKQVDVPVVKDIVIGGDLKVDSNGDSLFEVENDDTDFESSGMKDPADSAEVWPHWLPKHLAKHIKVYNTKQKKSVKRKDSRSGFNIHYQTHIPRKHSLEREKVNLEVPQQSPLALDRPFVKDCYPIDRGKKKRCKKNKRTGKKGKHSSMKHSIVSVYCMIQDTCKDVSHSMIETVTYINNISNLQQDFKVI